MDKLYSINQEEAPISYERRSTAVLCCGSSHTRSTNILLLILVPVLKQQHTRHFLNGDLHVPAAVLESLLRVYSLQ